jgi:hypothetical protein
MLTHMGAARRDRITHPIGVPSGSASLAPRLDISPGLIFKDLYLIKIRSQHFISPI